MEVATYAVENKIDIEPSFDWWVREHLKRQKCIIKMSQKQAVRGGSKFGMQLPNTVYEALELSRENKNTLWYDTIMKEMTNVHVAFQFKEKGGSAPVTGGSKFGMQLPNTVYEALELSRENKNTLWYDTIMKGMTNVHVAFQFKEKGGSAPVGYKLQIC